MNKIKNCIVHKDRKPIVNVIFMIAPEDRKDYDGHSCVTYGQCEDCMTAVYTDERKQIALVEGIIQSSLLSELELH